MPQSKSRPESQRVTDADNAAMMEIGKLIRTALVTFTTDFCARDLFLLRSRKPIDEAVNDLKKKQIGRTFDGLTEEDLRSLVEAQLWKKQDKDKWQRRLEKFRTDVDHNQNQFRQLMEYGLKNLAESKTCGSCLFYVTYAFRGSENNIVSDSISVGYDVHRREPIKCDFKDADTRPREWEKIAQKYLPPQPVQKSTSTSHSQGGSAIPKVKKTGANPSISISVTPKSGPIKQAKTLTVFPNVENRSREDLTEALTKYLSDKWTLYRRNDPIDWEHIADGACWDTQAHSTLFSKLRDPSLCGLEELREIARYLNTAGSPFAFFAKLSNLKFKKNPKIQPPSVPVAKSEESPKKPGQTWDRRAVSCTSIPLAPIPTLPASAAPSWSSSSRTKPTPLYATGKPSSSQPDSLPYNSPPRDSPAMYHPVSPRYQHFPPTHASQAQPLEPYRPRSPCPIKDAKPLMVDSDCILSFDSNRPGGRWDTNGSYFSDRPMPSLSRMEPSRGGYSRDSGWPQRYGAGESSKKRRIPDEGNECRRWSPDTEPPTKRYRYDKR